LRRIAGRETVDAQLVDLGVDVPRFFVPHALKSNYDFFRKAGMKLSRGPVIDPSPWIVKTSLPASPGQSSVRLSPSTR
jgi:hypothetical protein